MVSVINYKFLSKKSYLIPFFVMQPDFLKGVTYRKTDDPLLRKIYEKEDDGDEDVSKTVEKNGKQVDPRTDLFAAIRNRN